MGYVFCDKCLAKQESVGTEPDGRVRLSCGHVMGGVVKPPTVSSSTSAGNGATPTAPDEVSWPTREAISARLRTIKSMFAQAGIPYDHVTAAALLEIGATGGAMYWPMPIVIGMFAALFQAAQVRVVARVIDDAVAQDMLQNMDLGKPN